MMESHEAHKEQMTEDIKSVVGSRECQPIIFAGTGLSIRYFSAPKLGWFIREDDS